MVPKRVLKTPTAALLRIVKQALMPLGLVLALTTTLAVQPALTAQADPAPATSAVAVFDAKARATVVDTAAQALTDNYIFPDVATKAAAAIRQNLSAGHYDHLEGRALADQLTADLQSMTRDKHLRVTLDTPDTADTPASPPPAPSGMFLFKRADLLKGNIGYIKLTGFLPPELFKIGTDDVLAKLDSTDALIIDLRQNHGGDPAAVSYLVSFFADAGDPVHVNDIIWRTAASQTFTTEVFSTSQTPTGYRHKPVYLLTSPDTFSGGEEFAYDMKTLRLATLVGAVTGGGANPGHIWPLGFDFSIFVPTGRALNPVTHTNWEGVGVQPDMATAPDQAFGRAYAAALTATHQAGDAMAVAGPDDVQIKPVMVRRTSPYPTGVAVVKRQIAGLVAGQQPFDIFSPGMAEELKGPVPADLQALMQGLGALQTVTFVRVDDLGGDEYDVTFAGGEQIWNIVLASDGKVVSTNFRPK